MGSFFLQLYRIGALVAIAWMIRSHSEQIRVQGEWPINLTEVREFLPTAKKLKVDGGEEGRGGLFVLGENAKSLGYAVCTMPRCREILGYSGPTDALLVFDADDRMLGISIRHSYDTPSHVEDVSKDYLFMESWNGKSWAEIAAIDDYSSAGIYAVSGATRTSEALRDSIAIRLNEQSEASATTAASDFAMEWRDYLLILFVGLGIAFAYWKNGSFQKWRWLYSLATMLVLGLWLGDLLAQSLLIGWSENRIPWRETPGLVLLFLASFLVPWFGKQPVYCQFICPHGNLQRWMMKWLPARWKRPLSSDLKWVLRWVPVVLLLVVLIVSFYQLDLDLAGIEPFDAWLILSAGLATIGVAIVGLGLSLFYPMFYCKYGCPTGWLLEFVRLRSGRNRFSLRDWIGLGLVCAAVILYIQ